MSVSAACQAAFSFVAFSFASSNNFFLLSTSLRVVPPSATTSSRFSISFSFEFIKTCSEGVISDLVSIP